MTTISSRSSKVSCVNTSKLDVPKVHSRSAPKRTDSRFDDHAHSDIQDNGSITKQHIEVCVRLRPLIIQNEVSSSSFFGSKSKNKRVAGEVSKNYLNNLPRKYASGPAVVNKESRCSESRLQNSVDISVTRGTQRKPAVPCLSISPIVNELDFHELGSVALSSVCAWNVVSDDTVIQSPETDIVQGRTCQYTLDRVYGPSTTTEHLYNRSVKDLVNAAMDGYHTSVLAYGQTGTGKTHTMTGTAKEPGLIPLCIQQCFDWLKHQDNKSKNRDYLLRISYLEVYNEQIRDLLATNPLSAPPVRIFDNAAGQQIVTGLKEEVVTTPEQVFACLAQGEARRHVGATNMNAHSSRSHVMVRLWIESSEAVSSYQYETSPRRLTAENSGVRVSSLSLVDLAGSESIRLSGGVSERLQEGHYINKSLMALAKVVYALSENSKHESEGISTGKRKHVPYRDSKLTRLLQPSLAGNAQVTIICCISPQVNHLEESQNTLKFAVRAKKIPQKAVVQEGMSDEKTLLQSYREEIELLKRQLKDMQEQQEKMFNVRKMQDKAIEITPNPISNPLTPDMIVGKSRASTEIMSSNSSSMLTSVQAINTDEGMEIHDEAVHELIEAIQSMEKLILKSSSAGTEIVEENLVDSGRSTTQSSPVLLALDSVEDDCDVDYEYDESLLRLTSGNASYSPLPLQTASPFEKDRKDHGSTQLQHFSFTNHKELRLELGRIQSLLGSVLKQTKLKTNSNTFRTKNLSNLQVNSSVGNASVVSNAGDSTINTTLSGEDTNFNVRRTQGDNWDGRGQGQVVKALQQQLEQQKVSTCLREADASFLQIQLEEKDSLLAEVSALLEAVEQRQEQLEAENSKLRKDLVALQASFHGGRMTQKT